MKRFIFPIMGLLLLASCAKKDGYVINGTISDSDSSLIYLQQRVKGEYITVDSAMVLKGKYSFVGKVNIAEEYYLMKAGQDLQMFFLENADYSVVSDSSLLDGAKVSGGEVQKVYNDYDAKQEIIYAKMMDLYQQSNEEPDSILKAKMEEQVDSIYEVHQSFQKSFMLSHPHSPVAVYLLARIQYGMDAKELSSNLALMDSSLQAMVTYKTLAERVKVLESVAIGQIAPDFTQNDIDGSPITFSDVYNKNKYTLVDFWASWCGPCRRENPNVVSSFNYFKSKGFSVFGVSLDRNHDNWLKAIDADGLAWQHVSDLKGWGNEAAKTYGVNSIPANFLVSKTGTIVAVNLWEEELHKKLFELLNEE